MTEILQSFAHALQQAGLVVEAVRADGRLHRCGTEDKPRSRNGAYIAHLDAPALVWWRNWKTGDTGTWTAKDDKGQTATERKALRERIEAARVEAKAEQEKRWAAAAKLAADIWEKAGPADAGHPYLQRKGVLPLGGIRQTEKALLVPVWGEKGKLQSLQYILPEKPADGPEKPFLKGGRTAGGFCHIPAKDGSKDGPLLICEGYATGASLHMATGHAVLVAFSAGNLEAVARMARGRYPAREIVLCADNDCQTTKPDGTPCNPGKGAATKAAQAIGGKLAVCPAHEGRATDFNDLHQRQCLEAVAAAVEKARQSGALVEQDKLPSGFSIRKTGSLPGLWHIEPKDDGEPVETWVGGLLTVQGATRDEHGNAWGLLLEWQDDDGNPHTWAMPKAILAGRDSSAVIARLADEGWRFASGQRARNLFLRFLAEYQTKRRIRCVNRTGWHQGSFVFPDTTIKKSAGRTGRTGQAYSDNDLRTSRKKMHQLDELDSLPDEQTVLQVQTAHNPFRTGGTLDDWRETVGAWSRGNSRLMLALSASLAAALLEMSGMESGGINWTGQSSIGKSTALVAGASVWGRGMTSGGYVLNWRSTANGLEGLAALHSDAALCLDELGQAPGRTIAEASYMLGNGMGKARASQDGSARAVRSWRCMVLSTGEKGLAEKIAEEGGRVQAGQSVRLVDVPADAGAGMGLFENLHGHENPQAFADAIKRAAAADYGHAAREFIAKIVEERQEAEATLAEFMSEGLPLLSPADASGQVKRVARRFLLCAAAGEMAAEWGVLPWEEGEALAAVKSCFEAWLAQRGGAAPAEDTAILEQVQLFLEQHGASRFQDLDTGAATCINRAGFRREVDGKTEYYILPETFRKEICKGHDAKRAAAVLLDKGLLVRGDSGSMTRRPPFDLPGFGRKRCYVLSVGEGVQDVAV